MRQLSGLIAALAAVRISAPAFAQEPPPGETPPEGAPVEETTPPPEAEPPAPEPARTDEKPPGIVTYDKGTTITSGDGAFELKIVGRLQARWEMFRVDDGDDTTETEITDRFSIARARVTLEGHAFEDVDYKFQTEFGKGFTYLRDFYLDVPLASFRVRAGQWKKPYSRHQITSSGNLQLVDRSITDRFSGAGRDIGVAIHNKYEKSPDGLEWAVGVFNGTGDKPGIDCDVTVDPMTGEGTTDCGDPSNVPDDIGPQVVGRIGWNMGGIKGYSESDLEGGPLRLAAAASYMLDLSELDEDDGTPLVHRVGVDAMLKVNGLSLTGAFFLLAQKDVAADEMQTDVAFHVQAGYFITPKRFELAGRFAMVPFGDEDNTLEILGGFNWFLHGHSLKWQTDAGIIQTTTDPAVSTFVVRTQAQLVF